MRALELSLVGERVMRNGGVRTEGGHLHVADVATLPLVRLVLQILHEIVFRLPVPPAVSCHESVSQMLLRPRHIVLHLRISGVLL